GGRSARRTRAGCRRQRVESDGGRDCVAAGIRRGAVLVLIADARGDRPLRRRKCLCPADPGSAGRAIRRPRRRTAGACPGRRPRRTTGRHHVSGTRRGLGCCVTAPTKPRSHEDEALLRANVARRTTIASSVAVIVLPGTSKLLARIEKASTSPAADVT